MINKELLTKNFPEEGIGLLRISFGLMLAIAHGYPTVKGLLSGATDYPDPLGLGGQLSMGLMGFAEFICALLVTLGIFTRASLIPIIIGFITAFFIFHANDPFGNKEMAFHYLIVFAVLFITGPGKFTLSSFKRAL